MHGLTRRLTGACLIVFLVSSGPPLVQAQSGSSAAALQSEFDAAMQAVEDMRLRTARERLTSLLAANPSLSRARLELARVDYLSRDYASARIEAQRVLDDPDTPPTVRATVLAFLAQIDADERLLPSVRVRPSSGLEEILYQAMKAEKSAQNFYASLAKRVRLPKKRVLQYLSKVERSHFLMLQSEYTLAQQFEDYAEKDIDKVIT